MSTWIQISERLPTREDADEYGLVRYQNHKVRWMGLWNGSRVEYDNEPATHWHSLPPYTPPRPGPTDEECDAFAFILDCITSRDQFSVEARRWFADVTARIEREKGK
jgi:hypothetical protein